MGWYKFLAGHTDGRLLSVLGPYSEDELTAIQRGKRWLREVEEAEGVLVVEASTLEEARSAARVLIEQQ